MSENRARVTAADLAASLVPLGLSAYSDRVATAQKVPKVKTMKQLWVEKQKQLGLSAEERALAQAETFKAARAVYPLTAAAATAALDALALLADEEDRAATAAAEAEEAAEDAERAERASLKAMGRALPAPAAAPQLTAPAAAPVAGTGAGAPFAPGTTAASAAAAAAAAAARASLGLDAGALMPTPAADFLTTVAGAGAHPGDSNTEEGENDDGDDSDHDDLSQYLKPVSGAGAGLALGPHGAALTMEAALAVARAGRTAHGRLVERAWVAGGALAAAVGVGAAAADAGTKEADAELGPTDKRPRP
jgi:hypothetical protein